jgi:hypothetical protein
VLQKLSTWLLQVAAEGGLMAAAEVALVGIEQVLALL